MFDSRKIPARFLNAGDKVLDNRGRYCVITEADSTDEPGFVWLRLDGRKWLRVCQDEFCTVQYD